MRITKSRDGVWRTDVRTTHRVGYDSLWLACCDLLEMGHKPNHAAEVWKRLRDSLWLLGVEWEDHVHGLGAAEKHGSKAHALMERLLPEWKKPRNQQPNG